MRGLAGMGILLFSWAYRARDQGSGWMTGWGRGDRPGGAQTQHKNNLWALHTGHTRGIRPLALYWIYRVWGGAFHQNTEPQECGLGKQGGQEVPCPHGFGSSRRFSREHQTSLEWPCLTCRSEVNQHYQNQMTRK